MKGVKKGGEGDLVRGQRIVRKGSRNERFIIKALEEVLCKHKGFDNSTNKVRKGREGIKKREVYNKGS